MAAIFADAAVFGFKGLSKGTTTLSVYEEKSMPVATETWDNLRPQVFNVSTFATVLVSLKQFVHGKVLFFLSYLN